MTSTNILISHQTPRLSLGTATFGYDYGIANQSGKISSLEVKEILLEAAELNISHLDTAPAYGSAQQLIGEFWPEDRPLNLTTKVSPEDCRTASSILKTVQDSLVATQVTNFWSVLLHEPSVLFGEDGKEVKAGLLQVLDSGLAARIGISAYSEAEVIRTKEFMPELTVFQIPENVCDRRKYFSGNITAMSQQGDQFFVRSVFLQGLLLMESEDVPKKVRGAEGILIQIHEFCRENSISVLELCLGYAKSIPWASGIVVGVASVEQFRRIAITFQSVDAQEYGNVPQLDDWLIDPRNWS